MRKELPKGFKAFLLKGAVFWVLFILIQVMTMWLVSETQLPKEIKPFSMTDLAKAAFFMVVLFVGFNKEKIMKIGEYSVRLRTRILSAMMVLLGLFFYFPYKRYMLDNMSFVKEYIYIFSSIEYLILLIILSSLVVLVFGFKFCLDFIKKFRKGLLFILAGIPLVYILIVQFQKLWPYFSGFVGKSVVYLLSFIGASGIYFIEELPVVSFRDFVVGIARTCSGIDSILMFSFLYFGILAWDWKILNKKKAFSLFIVGVAGAFALNIVRIFLLILAGAYISKSFALNIFHTNASSVLFILYFFIFWKLSYKWMSRKNSKDEIGSVIEEIKEKSIKTISEAEKALGTKKAKRIEKYIVIFLYIIVFGIAGYFFLSNYFPENAVNIGGDYEISASDSFLTNNLMSLYIDSNSALGGETDVDGKTLRFIISEEPFNIVFNPKKIVAENSTAELQMWLHLKTGTEVYLDDKLIIPDLDGYEDIIDFENEQIWIKRGLKKTSYIGAENAKDFIYANFPERSVYSFAEENEGVPIILDYEKTTTKIPTQFRGDLKLAVYAEGDLEISFMKKDLNWYVGKDEYTVEIVDYRGNSFYKQVYPDDGHKKDDNKEGGEQFIEVKGEDLPRNIYYVTFAKDKNNKGSDSTISRIEINSNKVLILGNSLPLDQFKFYTKAPSSKKISFMYWHSGKEQEIRISGTEEKIIDLNESWKGVKYEEKLKKGEYYFNIEIGDLWVYSDVISPLKKNWFYLPGDSDNKLINSDIIIVDKNNLQINGPEIFYRTEVNVSDGSKFKLQVLDKLNIYFERFRLEI